MASVLRRPARTLARREAAWAYALIAPWIVGFLVFTRRRSDQPRKDVA